MALQQTLLTGALPLRAGRLLPVLRPPDKHRLRNSARPGWWLRHLRSLPGPPHPDRTLPGPRPHPIRPLVRRQHNLRHNSRPHRPARQRIHLPNHRRLGQTQGFITCTRVRNPTLPQTPYYGGSIDIWRTTPTAIPQPHRNSDRRQQASRHRGSSLSRPCRYRLRHLLHPLDSIRPDNGMGSRRRRSRLPAIPGPRPRCALRADES